MFLSRFIEGVSLDAGSFFERWKVIGGESYFGTIKKSADGFVSRPASGSTEDFPYPTHFSWRSRPGEECKGHVRK